MTSPVNTVNITVYNCSMHKNTASVGANMFLSVHQPLYSTVTVRINNCKLFGGTSISKGGGVMLHIDSDGHLGYYLESDDYPGHLSVYLTNSELYNNSAANGSSIYFGVEMGIFQMSQVCSSFISVDAMTTLANMGQECMCIYICMEKQHLLS